MFQFELLDAGGRFLARARKRKVARLISLLAFE